MKFRPPKMEMDCATTLFITAILLVMVVYIAWLNLPFFNKARLVFEIRVCYVMIGESHSAFFGSLNLSIITLYENSWNGWTDFLSLFLPPIGCFRSDRHRRNVNTYAAAKNEGTKHTRTHARTQKESDSEFLLLSLLFLSFKIGFIHLL